MKKVFLLFGLFIMPLAQAQETQQFSLNKQVHSFLYQLQDSPIADSPYLDSGISYGDFDNFDSTTIGVKGAYPINQKVEIGAELAYLKLNPNGGSSESGLSDLKLVAKYNIKPGPIHYSAGGFITLPIGKEEVGQDKVDLGAFAAVRHSVSSTIVIIGQLGFHLLEISQGNNNKDREFSLNVGGGAIFLIDQELSFVAEAELETETDELLLFGGADYAVKRDSRFRGGIGVGLDDGSPDLLLRGSYLVTF
jgi:hypothetical protein